MRSTKHIHNNTWAQYDYSLNSMLSLLFPSGMNWPKKKKTQMSRRKRTYILASTSLLTKHSIKSNWRKELNPKVLVGCTSQFCPSYIFHHSMINDCFFADVHSSNCLKSKPPQQAHWSNTFHPSQLSYIFSSLMWKITRLSWLSLFINSIVTFVFLRNFKAMTNTKEQ